MANFKLSKIQFSFLETATSGGTLTLVGSSKQFQILTGISNHTVQLPNATTMGTGLSFVVDNVSTGIITVQLNDAVTILGTVAVGSTTEFILTNNGTSNGTWRTSSGGASSNAGIGGQGPGAPKTSNYAVVNGDKNGVILVDTTSNVVSITLPSPAIGFNVTIKDVGGNAEANPITIQRSSSSLTIDNEVNDDIINKSFTSISYLSDGTNWFRVSSIGLNTSGVGLFGGGFVSGYQTTIDFITMSTTVNAVSFGSLTAARSELGTCSSSTRGVFGDGYTGSNSAVVDYITISAPSNATNFGTLTTTRSDLAGCGNSTRGIFGGGFVAAVSAVMDYITIASVGNAISFGNLTQGREATAGLASPTRGIFGGGITASPYSNVMDYITIASTGNATSFGNLTTARQSTAGCSNSITGLFAGGYNGSTTAAIDTITIASTGNATNFGNLSAARMWLAGCSSSTRGVFAGGDTTGPTLTHLSNTIDYVTIAILSNASNFGILTQARGGVSGCSNVHGGLS